MGFLIILGAATMVAFVTALTLSEAAIRKTIAVEKRELLKLYQKRLLNFLILMAALLMAFVFFVGDLFTNGFVMVAVKADLSVILMAAVIVIIKSGSALRESSRF